MSSGGFSSRTMTQHWWRLSHHNSVHDYVFHDAALHDRNVSAQKRVHAKGKHWGAITTGRFIRSLFSYPSNSSTSLNRSVSPSFLAAGTDVTFSCLLPLPKVLFLWASSCPGCCDTQQIVDVYDLTHVSRRFSGAGTADESPWLIHCRSFINVNLSQKDWQGHAGPSLLRTLTLPPQVTIHASCWKTTNVVEPWCPRDHIHFAGIASAGRSRGIGRTCRYVCIHTWTHCESIPTQPNMFGQDNRVSSPPHSTVACTSIDPAIPVVSRPWTSL